MTRLVTGSFRLFGLVIVAFFAFPLAGLAQSGKTPALIPYRKGDLWGFADRNRQVVIKPVFEEVTLFHGNLAKVKQDQKWGLINRQGAFLAEPKYDELLDISHSLIGFRQGLLQDSRQGFLDTLGREAIVLPSGHRIQIQAYTPTGHQVFSEDRAIIYGKTDQNQEGGLYYIDQSGQRITSQIITEARPFRRGTAVVNSKDPKGLPRQTILDKNGRDLLPLTLEYHDTASFNGQPCFIVRTRSHFTKTKNNEFSVNYKRKYQFGLINKQGELVVPVTFRSILVKNGFVMVYDWFGKGGLWDFDKRQKLTNHRFDHFQATSQPSRAAVTSLNKQGLLDSTGKFIIPLARQVITPEKDYQHTYQQFKGLGLNTPYFFYLKKDGHEIAVDPFGKPLKGFHLGVLEKITDSLILINHYKKEGYSYYPGQYKSRTGKPVLGIMDIRGNILVNPVFNYMIRNEVNNQLILGNDSQVHFFSFSGNTVKEMAVRIKQIRSSTILPQSSPKIVTPTDLEPRNLNSCFYVQQQLANGYTIVANTCLYNLKSFGLTDAAGTVIIPFHYNEIYPLSANSLAVRQANKWGVLELNGKTQLPVVFDAITKLEKGAFLTGKKIENSQFIYTLRDSTGNITLKEKLLAIPNFSTTTAWVVQTETGQILIDRDGKILSKKPLVLGNNSRNDENGLYRIYSKLKAGYIDTTGKVMIPFRYDQVKPFKEGLAAVAMGGKWGYIDRTGKVIIPFKFNKAHPFSEAKAFVLTDDGYQVISRSGKLLFSGNYQDAANFSEGLAAVKIFHKWGFVNDKGKLVIPYKYDELSEFNEGLAIFKIQNGQGYLNKKGVMIVPPVYSRLQPFQNNHGWMFKDNTWYQVNRMGTVVDSTTTEPTQLIARPRVFLKNATLYRKNRDGTEIPLGNYNNIQPESEGLIGVFSANNFWYYADENGNQFYEED